MEKNEKKPKTPADMHNLLLKRSMTGADNRVKVIHTDFNGKNGLLTETWSVPNGEMNIIHKIHPDQTCTTIHVKFHISDCNNDHPPHP